MYESVLFEPRLNLTVVAGAEADGVLGGALFAGGGGTVSPSTAAALAEVEGGSAGSSLLSFEDLLFFGWTGLVLGELNRGATVADSRIGSVTARFLK